MATTCGGAVVLLGGSSIIHQDRLRVSAAAALPSLKSDPSPPGSGPSPPSFTYSRASPSVRWPSLKLSSNPPPLPQPPPPPPEAHSHPDADDPGPSDSPEQSFPSDDLDLRGLSARHSRTRVKKMNKLALKRAKDWRERVKFYTDRILSLPPEGFVADVLEDRPVQMTPTDFCFVVKSVGRVSWQRALEVYEWLNLRHWYSPNPRMVATILSVLGRGNQDLLAEEIFQRAKSSAANTVQVYNAMMGVYARKGKFDDVRKLLDVMRRRGCVPDLVSFNTLINARLKAGPMVPNLGMELLDEVRRSGVRPDIITYNTLISSCAHESNLEEASKIFRDMEASNCQPDLWTYNAMISVYGRCGLSAEAEQLFRELETKGFFPDAVTYNSLLYAFAKVGNIEKVKEICQEMVKKGFGEDEMTYNTVIHMYGKQGRYDLAMQVYEEMKSSGRIPDAVTYTVLIDSLGKAGKTTEASSVMSQMLDAGVKPTLRTYTALICAYAKAGKRVEAENTFDCMCRSGIKPDLIAYSVVLDILWRFNEVEKAPAMYQRMLDDGYRPDRTLYEVMVGVLVRENNMEMVENLVRDMTELCDMSPSVIASILVKGECYDRAATILRVAIDGGSELGRDELISLMSALSSSGRHTEAVELLELLREKAGPSQLLSEVLVVMLCKAGRIEAALGEYSKTSGFSSFGGTCQLYESLIQCCMEHELFAEASQMFTDMRFYGIETSKRLYESMIVVYCRMGFPETAHSIVDQADVKGIVFGHSSPYITVIEAYGAVKQWQKAESLVGCLRQRCTVDRTVWNALIQAYAANGCYERARAVFNTMMRDGPAPTVESINGLLQALITGARLEELYVVIHELQDMGFKISKSSIIIMLDAFARAGNIFEVKKIYAGMKAAGYFPTMHLYRVIMALFCKGKRVRDVEAMISEMEEAGFKPDISIWNSVLKLYTTIGDYRKAVQVYQQIQAAGLQPDEDTFNTLITMYCRDRRPDEGLLLMHEMSRIGCEPKLDTYKSLISAFGKQEVLEQAEELFLELQTKGYNLDRSFYHVMMKLYRNSGDHSKAENLLLLMKEAGVEPTIATMHLLMVSYGISGCPLESEKVLDNLKMNGVGLSTLPYSSMIDAYLKNGDYNTAIQKLGQMKDDEMEPDHRIWTCFVRAASLAHHSHEAINLLNALKFNGFDLPLRLLTEKKCPSVRSDVEHYLDFLKPLEDNAAFNFVNALEDMLWAFELRACASWIFQVAVKKNIYRHDVFRVAVKDWGADFRKLSAGAALVGLTLWLDHMQDASLQGHPESPKSVVLITGTAEYNSVSLNSTLKVFLWEMGSPFLPCKTRSGLLVAKSHALRMWLKDSPFCADLELRDAPSLPDLNSMQLMEGCFLRRGIVPAFKDITEKLGVVSPKKFAKLALLSSHKREKAIRADIIGGKEKMEKLKKKALATKMEKINNYKK
ncbi:hypothetical protein MLD38_008911 [Melastoma candidum]|uniref:Uncharacterized protein n=1 Tax=Melastoma candidum TaxID=119954 RepID=A0ACB9RZK7_9MYRT|nr:hypothetical protein MLD38_008911 [Melastoma candidum]